VVRVVVKTGLVEMTLVVLVAVLVDC